ncbi:S41 family peptidase [Kozakia baliensis]|uniref:Tricorn protease homolog n=1 Tax=Kozakia baliensis TaxID=153496 RepID=A0A1D8UW05_9PROT|nr:S41 family peptidase [Kozakia baliensis]AOX17838.1 hypothetical protein A0U89_12590 [Kozakia baliensis]GBR33536.1 peptidase S41 [Kozakia baliensis NRIC 0488]GEL64925.1 tricorn protease [Kozakia baliensis]
MARSLRIMRGLSLLAMVPLAFRAPAKADGNQHVLMRYPSLHGESIVFVAHGNLWKAPRQGGAAQRLTADAGQDLMPRFSPDGKWIAFTASYQGNRDVYVMPANGGEARRLTYHSDIVPRAPDRWGPDNLVTTWTPDSQAIVFLSRRKAWNSWLSQPYTVPLTGGLPTAMPLDQAGFMSFAPDGHTIALTRIFRDFRTWKRYNGGLAQSLFRYDLDSRKLDRLTDWSDTSTQPMWFGRRIYFLSDHDAHRRANIWVLDLDTNKTHEVTHFNDFDVDFPSLGDNGLVFQQGGALWVMDLPSETLKRLDITVPDDGSRTMARPISVQKSIRAEDYAQQPDFALSPNGKRAALVARGDIFTLPAEHGAVRDLNNSSDADDDHPVFSPDGAQIAYTSDKGGEQQIWLRPANGGAGKALTHFKDGYRYGPIFSPDGKMLAFSDNLHRLWVTGLDGPPTQVAQDPVNEIHDQAFSPDGRYLAFSMTRPNHLSGLYLYEMSNGQLTPMGGSEADSSPRFSKDGQHLFFLSQRQEHPLLDEHEFNAFSLRSKTLYVTTLSAKAPSPLPPRTDESGPATPKEEHKEATSPTTEHKPDNTPTTLATISPYGLMTRAVPVPDIAPGIDRIYVGDDAIFYTTQPLESLDGKHPDGGKPGLHRYDLKARKDEVIVEDFAHLTLSEDGAHMLFQRKKDWFIADAKPKSEPHKLALDQMRAIVTPPKEWTAMYDEAWRMERDFFFNPQTNGVDWAQVHDDYARFVPLLGSSADLTYLLGSIQGELGNSHTYAQTAPDADPIPLVPTGLLGADYTLDEASGRYRIAHILAGDSSRPDYRAPLAQPGLNLQPGDYLLAIDGEELRAPDDPDRLLVGKKGPVTLTIASELTSKRRDIVVETVDSEMSLREQEWIDHNRAVVDRLSHGQIAYIYLSDMEALGMQQFIRQFYTQRDKRAVIVDDRFNGGGNIDEILLERLRRTLEGLDVDRDGASSTVPEQLINGPKVALINHYSASDGDIFPFYFRQYGLGKLIGTRSWGGVRGIRGMWPLLDGTAISIPEFALYNDKSQWVIENHGVDPDIVVEDEPADLLAGHDRQLETAVSTLMSQLANKPAGLPAPPAWLPAYPPGPETQTHHD